MARDYAAEQRARELRARRSGFKSYGHERSQREAENQAQRAERIQREQGWQGPFTAVQIDPDWEQITPTRTSYSEGPNKDQENLRMRPSHRRTIAARYQKTTGRMEVMYSGNGAPAGDAPYFFNGVPATVWQQFKRHWSPGRYLYYFIEPTYGEGESLNPKTGATRTIGLRGGFNSITQASREGEATI